MNTRLLKIALIFCFSLALVPYAKVQDATTTEKTITLGSHVLTQDGTDEYAYNNGPYKY